MTISNLTNNKYFSLLLVILCGLLILSPALDFQEGLSQGDHGRDLYSFKKTYEGQAPYKDYWTQNGPLMPYYYAVFYRFFGPTIQTTLLGYYLLVLLIGIFVFLACATFTKPFTAFLCALWYWAFRGTELFYTYNHIGAIFLISVIVFCSLAYIKNQRTMPFLCGLLAILLCTLIRPNIGFACLVAFIFSTFGADVSLLKKPASKSFLKSGIGFFLVLFLSFSIYKFFTNATPAQTITTDLNYSRYIYFESIAKALLELPRVCFAFFNMDWFRRFSAGILIFCAAGLFLYFRREDQEETKALQLALLALAIFSALILCEFLVSAKWFRYRWAFVPLFLLMFLVIDFGSKRFSLSFKLIINTVLSFTLIVSLVTYHKFIASCKAQNILLSVGENNVYLMPDQEQWASTVSAVSEYIGKNSLRGEKILALPYEPIYYFLTDRESATRGLSIEVIPAQNLKSALETVNLLLVSNWYDRIATKIDYSHYGFVPVKTIGPWEKEASWVGNHGVKIHKKISDDKK
jgi:hypothetical protein